MDWYGSSPPDDGLSTVTVKDVPMNDVNLLDESNQYGTDLLLTAVNILRI